MTIGTDLPFVVCMFTRSYIWLSESIQGSKTWPTWHSLHFFIDGTANRHFTDLPSVLFLGTSPPPWPLLTNAHMDTWPELNLGLRRKDRCSLVETRAGDLVCFHQLEILPHGQNGPEREITSAGEYTKRYRAGRQLCLSAPHLWF